MRRIAALSLCLALAGALAADAARVRTQLAPGADLSKLTTYRWDRPVGPGPEGLDGKIRAAAEKGLAEHGLKRAPDDGSACDLVVSYNVGSADLLTSGFSVNAGYWGDLVVVPGNDSNVSAGLILFVSDPASKEALWAGWMILKGTSEQALMVMRDRAPGYVGKILARYPKKR
jgi:hypothetical protein